MYKNLLINCAFLEGCIMHEFTNQSLLCCFALSDPILWTAPDVVPPNVRVSIAVFAQNESGNHSLNNTAQNTAHHFDHKGSQCYLSVGLDQAHTVHQS